MAQTATPDDVLRIFSACEAAYADASQKGYANSPDVIAAVADLKSAYRALVIANGQLAVSKSSFDKNGRNLACSSRWSRIPRGVHQPPRCNRESGGGKSS
jgi:hypothetical protein